MVLLSVAILRQLKSKNQSSKYVNSVYCALSELMSSTVAHYEEIQVPKNNLKN